MKVPTTVGRGDTGINLTPMIDVVFQLIIFFLVSSHLAKQESRLQLPLPVAHSGETPQDQDSRRVTLNILQDGSLVLAGRPVPASQLSARLTEARAAHDGNVEVRIRGDRSTPYRLVEPVLRSCAKANVWDVKFSVYRPEDVR